MRLGPIEWQFGVASGWPNFPSQAAHLSRYDFWYSICKFSTWPELNKFSQPLMENTEAPMDAERMWTPEIWGSAFAGFFSFSVTQTEQNLVEMTTTKIGLRAIFTEWSASITLFAAGALLQMRCSSDACGRGFHGYRVPLDFAAIQTRLESKGGNECTHFWWKWAERGS